MNAAEEQPPEDLRPVERHEKDDSPPQPMAAADQGSRPSGLRRYRYWLVPVALVAAILTWRALSGGEAPRRGFQQTQITAVRAAAVSRGDLELLSTYPGEIAGEVTDIAPQVSGILREIPVRIGDHISRGQVMAIIDDVDLRNQSLEARAQLGVAKANELRSQAELESATAEHRRARELHEQELLSAQEFDRVSAALATASASLTAAEAQSMQAEARSALLERQLADSRVLAPFDGVIADRYVDRGTLLQPGTPILRLVEDGPLRVQFRVPERDLGTVRVGVPFLSTTVATGERTFSGSVKRVSGEVSRSDRTAIVEGEINESDEVLKPGMYAEVRVQLRGLERELIVPSTAVVDRVAPDGIRSVGVFVVAAPDTDASEAAEGEGDDEQLGTATWVSVEALGSSEGLTAVRGDVREGDLALTMGHQDLRDGASIRVVQVENTTRLQSSNNADPRTSS